jgi:hypothetical protein
MEPVEITTRREVRQKGEKQSTWTNLSSNTYNIYIYTWKCHSETPCRAILNKNTFFEKWRTGRQNRSYLEVGTSGMEEDIRQGCRRVEVVTTHVWKWKKKTSWNYSGNGKGGIKENDGGVNSTMTCCKDFYKCHSVSQYSNKMVIK